MDDQQEVILNERNINLNYLNNLLKFNYKPLLNILNFNEQNDKRFFNEWGFDRSLVDPTPFQLFSLSDNDSCIDSGLNIDSVDRNVDYSSSLLPLPPTSVVSRKRKRGSYYLNKVEVLTNLQPLTPNIIGRNSNLFKSITNSDWRLSLNDLKYRKVVDKINNNSLYSFKQPRKHKLPSTQFDHWDYVLSELKWIQQDFKLEKRWKISMAYIISHAILDYHNAKNDFERAKLCVNVKKPIINLEYNDNFESNAQSNMEIDLEENQNVNDLKIDSETPQFTLPSSPSKPFDQNQTLPSINLEPVVKNDKHFFTDNNDNTNVNNNQIFQSRIPILNTNKFDPLIELSTVDNVNENQYSDLSQIFPDLPPYLPPPPPSSSSSNSKLNRRHDFSSSSSNKLTPISRLMDYSPTLVSSLTPSKHLHNKQWDLSSFDIPFDDEYQSFDGVQYNPDTINNIDIASKLFLGNNKKFKDKQSSNISLPTERSTSAPNTIYWSDDDDNLLASLTRAYTQNWNLVADAFNGHSGSHKPSDRRTAWDCYERWKFKQTQQSGSNSNNSNNNLNSNNNNNNNNNSVNNNIQPNSPLIDNSNQNKKDSKKKSNLSDQSRRQLRRSQLFNIISKASKKREKEVTKKECR